MRVDFESLALKSHDLLCLADAGGHLRWVNPRWATVTGWSDEELLGSQITRFVHPDDRAPLDASFANSSNSGVEVRLRFRRKDGAQVWLEWAAQPYEGGVYATVRDITDRVETEREVQEHLRMWDLAAGAADIGFFHYEVARNRLRWSPEIYTIHGLDPADYEPRYPDSLDAYHPDDRLLVRAQWERALNRCESFRYAHRIVRPDGEVRHVVVHGDCARASGRPSVFGVVRDVTSDESMRAMHDFFYAVSHDLSEPVRTIRSFANIVSTDKSDGLDEEGIRYLGYIEDGADRMGQLIAAVLRYTKTGARLPVTVIDPVVVANEALADLSAAVEESGATIEIGPLARCLANPVRLRQVFANLFTNALKFVRPGEKPHIVVSGSTEGADVFIQVTDRGTGVPASQREEVFRVFKRLVRRDESSGSGMGLAIVKRSMEQFAGDVWLTENPDGPGTVVNLRLPASPESGSESCDGCCSEAPDC